MTEKHTEGREIIDRYLAGRLDDKERAMVETRIVHDARFRNDVELTAALRDGLRQLQAQGQVEPLLRARPWMWARSPLAVAAALVACAIGVAIFLAYRPVDGGRQVPATQTLLFMTTRGSDTRPDVTWQRSPEPKLIEMRFDVGLEPAPEYRVVIVSASNAEAAPVFEALAGRTTEGDVSIAVDPALLQPGDYRIRLAPQPPDGLQDATTYTLRVAG